MFSIARTIEISGGRGITFRNTAPKNLSFTNRLAMLITSALKSIKRGNVTKEQISRISELLHKEDKDSVLADLRLMPEWIREIILQTYDE